MTKHRALIFVAIAALLLLPIVTEYFNQPYYIGLATRILIFAIAASSLNLLLGYGGMLNFGHAAYLGIGAYTVAILAHHHDSKALLLNLIPRHNQCVDRVAKRGAGERIVRVDHRRHFVANP